ncbi:unnamed protein product [Symbiodinium sp. KB8]|nr:unnamed protein product [Symbiodinium sp. KB8]
MAFAVAQRAGYGRSGSRSPRLQKQVEVEADHGGPDGLPCDFKGGFNAQMRMQRDFLAQFLVPEQPHAAKSPNAPREAAAGLPVEAAKVLMLGPGPGRVPWLGLPAGVACVAATLQLFSRLLPGSVAEGMCDELCKQATADPSMPVELDALATRVGLVSCPVPSAVPSLQDMVKNRMTACCVLLESYVGVIEDEHTGEELEEEVGSHCVLVVGGDLLGPNYVTFDPWGLRGGEVSLWQSHSMAAASPLGWVQLSLPAPSL